MKKFIPPRVPKGLAPIERQIGMLLGQPNLSEQLMRALDLKGDLPNVVEPIFQLGVQALDLGAIEYSWLRRTLEFGGRGNAVAVAARFSNWLLACPVAVSAIAVVRNLTIINTSAAVGDYNVQVGAGLPTTSFGTNGPRDTRVLGTLTPAFQVQMGDQAAVVAPPVLTIRLAVNECRVLPNVWVLTGDTGGLNVICTAANAGFVASADWAERALLTTER